MVAFVFAALVALGPAAAAASAGFAQLRGNATAALRAQLGTTDASTGNLHGPFVLAKRFDLAADPSQDFEVEAHSDENLTHSCSDYVNDGSTVFSRDGNLVLKVAAACEGGGCLKSGRVMSKASFKYGLFTFSARVPKCNFIWPALWLLPNNTNGEGVYGRWPCSGEIDVLETVHEQNFGAFNVVAGYGSTDGCYPHGEVSCNRCLPTYCTSTTMDPSTTSDRYFVEETNCHAEHPSWEEHRFVLSWQPDQITTWVDPVLSYDAAGHLASVAPRAPLAAADGVPSWRVYERTSTPTWSAVGNFMQQCFPGLAGADAPFDDGFKIVMNIAVGGYGGAPCMWGSDACQTTCGGAIGSELVVSDVSVWEFL